MRIGLIGCGQVADFGHLPAIISTPGFQLTALCDPLPGRAEQFASRFGGTAFTSPEEFFTSGIGVVSVTSSAPAHRENVLAAARHHLPVLCEKPIAMNDEEGDEMIAAMDAAGKEFFVGFCYRFSPVAQQIKKWVDEERVGPIRAMRLIYIWNLHGEYMQSADGTWERSPFYVGRMDEGGPLVDCGVHQIDLARWWLGEEPVGWSASGAWMGEYKAPGHVWLHLAFPSGATATIEVSYQFTHNAREPRSEFSYELIGDGGVIRYDRDGYILEARHGAGTDILPGASEKNFPGLYAALHRRLSGEDVQLPTARDGLIATRIARNATEALIANRTMDGSPFASGA